MGLAGHGAPPRGVARAVIDMLRFLGISRLAIIDAVEMEFGPGLNVLTGETGAGKSIVVGALELLVGGRASADLIRTGADTAQVQAVLETPDGCEVIVRRELTASGRSRAFVDGALVTSAALRETTAPLIDLHGQHDHQALLQPESHLSLLDRFAGLENESAHVADAFRTWREAREALEASQMSEQERNARLELLSFQLGEIDRVDPRAGEDTELEASLRVLQQAERLQRLCNEAYQDLYEADGAVLEKLSRVWRRIDELAQVDPGFDHLAEVRASVTSHLQELAFLLRDRFAHLDASPEQLQRTADRLAALDRLKRRHGPTLEEALTNRDQLRAEQAMLSTAADRLKELTEALDSRRAAFLSEARRLHARREEGARTFGKALAGELADLAMAGATCTFRFQSGELPESRWTPAGVQTGELYLSANPGETPKPLTRIASGGELSRVMLALKTLATVDSPGKTLVFDEVDAGVGGRTADAVGARLRRLGQQFQVLCVTHLPQVAAFAHQHYQVAKRASDNRTTTAVERLGEEGRVAEVARMMGGQAITPALLQAARDLVDAKAKGESETKSKAKAKVAARVVRPGDEALGPEP